MISIPGPERSRRHCLSSLLTALGVLLLMAAAGRAQSGGPYDLSWSSVDGGGATSLSGGVFSLGGTAGQPDAGAAQGGGYALLGGFWGSNSVAVGIPEDSPGDASPVFVFRLHAGVPNPFNPSTRIAFELPTPGPARLAVYDVRGALVRILADGTLPAGPQERVWDGRDGAGRPVASGVYFFRFDAGSRQALQKGVLLK